MMSCAVWSNSTDSTEHHTATAQTRQEPEDMLQHKDRRSGSPHLPRVFHQKRWVLWHSSKWQRVRASHFQGHLDSAQAGLDLPSVLVQVEARANECLLATARGF